MTGSVSSIVVRSGEKRSRVVRVSTPPDQANEHRLSIAVESGGELELQELHEAGNGDGAISIESEGSLELHKSSKGNPRAAGLLMRVRVHLGSGAKMRHVAVVDSGGPGAYRFDRRIELEQGAELDYTRVGAPGAPRPELEHLLSGAGQASDDELLLVAMNGARSCFRHAALMIAEPGREAALDLTMTHKAPHAVSESLCRCILGAHSTGRFRGRIVIPPEGQGADARLRNDNLLLDETARIDSYPELEVYADEVKCAHGAATGALDEAALFYLRARGLSPRQARAMLVRAFASRISDAIGAGEAQALAGVILNRAFDGNRQRRLAA